MQLQLQFSDRMSIAVQGMDLAAFMASAVYKLQLRRYTAGEADNALILHDNLTYLDFKRIIALCERYCEKSGTGLCIDAALTDYINSREMYLNERSRVGMELKAHDPKLQTQFNDFATVVNAAMARPLRERQMWDAFYLLVMKKAANFSVPGSGKTSVVLGMFAYLQYIGKASRIVVLCPKNAFGSWMDEFAACFGDKQELRVFNIHDPQYTTIKSRRNALKLDSGLCNLFLINYESVGSVLPELTDIVAKNTLLVLDEVHKVKRINGAYATNTVELAKAACYVVAMTGTPIPNTYKDIYNMLHILYPDEYDEFFRFSPQTLKDPTQQDIQDINDKLQPFFCRTTKTQLQVPAAEPDKFAFAQATSAENRLLSILSKKYARNKLGLLIRLIQLESNPHNLLTALNLADFKYLLDDEGKSIDEIDFADFSEEIQRLIVNCPPATKFTACVDLVSSLVQQGKPVIVWCVLVSSIYELSDALNRQGVATKCIYGEIPLTDRLSIMDDFKAGRFQVLLTNPHTLAESVSLHSICHDAVYYEYSYNLVHLLQSKDRIHRLGLPAGQYTQYYYMGLNYEVEGNAWSMDRQVYDRLAEKEQTMLDAIDNHVLETLPSSQEDLDMIFAQIL